MIGLGSARLLLFIVSRQAEPGCGNDLESSIAVHGHVRPAVLFAGITVCIAMGGCSSSASYVTQLGLVAAMFVAMAMAAALTMVPAMLGRSARRSTPSRCTSTTRTLTSTPRCPPGGPA
jgi:RND superfamily putative drug exporter